MLQRLHINLSNIGLGLFLERHGNFSDQKTNFKIKTCWIVAPFLAHKPNKIASLSDSFIVLFSKLLKLWSWMQTRQTQNSFPGLKSYRNFLETGPWPIEEGFVWSHQTITVLICPHRSALTGWVFARGLFHLVFSEYANQSQFLWRHTSFLYCF